MGSANSGIGIAYLKTKMELELINFELELKFAKKKTIKSTN